MALRTRPALLTGFAAFFLVLSTGFVLLRAYVRVRIRGLSYDDYAIFCAQIFFLALVSVLFEGIKEGFGLKDVHLPIHSYADQERVNHSYAMFFLLWPVTLFFIKISVCLSLTRIVVDNVKLWIIRGVMVLVFLLTVANTTLSLTSCHPYAVTWGGAEGTCLPVPTVLALAYFNVISSIVTDIIVACLPYMVLHQLKLSPTTKRSLTVILSIGIVTSFATISRAFYVKEYVAFGDRNYVIVPTMYICLVECAVGISTACAPSLKPLFKPFLERSTVGDDSVTPYGSSKARSSRSKSGFGVSSGPASESEEDMVERGGIVMTSRVTVEEEHVDDAGR